MLRHQKRGFEATGPCSRGGPKGCVGPGVSPPSPAGDTGKTGRCRTSGNAQLDTPESAECPEALCFMGRLLAGVFLTQREVKGPCLSGLFPWKVQRPPQWPGFPKPLPKYFVDLWVQRVPVFVLLDGWLYLGAGCVDEFHFSFF